MIALALAALLTTWPVAAGAADSPAKQAASLKKRQLTVIAQLDELDRRLSRLAAQQRRLKAEKARLDEAARRAEAKELELAAAKRVRLIQLRTRLKAIYTHGGRDAWRMILEAPSLGAATTAWQGLLRIVEFDLKLIKNYNNLAKSLGWAERERMVRRAEIKDLSGRLLKAREELARQRRERARILLRLEERRQDYEQAVAELDRATVALTKELAAIEARSQRAARGELGRAKGRLVWPVAGKLSRTPGVERPGVLILAREGTAVKAVGGGKVVFAGWVKGYGLVTIVDHGDRYYTLSGHLQEIRVKEGEMIEAGQTLGLVGRAGLAKPGVYFEIRHRDKPEDPRRWLAGASG